MITYHDLPFLREVLPVLLKIQKRLSADVVLMDTAWNDEIRSFLKKEYPSIEYLRHSERNIGYGRSYNEILKHKGAQNYDLFWVTTSDVLANVSTVECLVKRMRKNPSVVMATGKLYHWDFLKGVRTRQIDTLGIMAHKSHHFFDRGQGEEDRGQYDEELGHFFGISGASFFIRTDIICSLHGKPEVLFDPAFWMYKEDIDLSYRLRWLNARLELYPEVLGWHARTVANRKGQNIKAWIQSHRTKKTYARLHSYQNHFLLLKNHWNWAYGPRIFLTTFIYELLKSIYVLFHSPRVFVDGMRVFFFRRGHRSKKRIAVSKMLSYFS